MRHRSGLIGSTCLFASFLALAQGCGASDSTGTDGADGSSETDSATPSTAENPTDASVPDRADSGPTCKSNETVCGGTCVDTSTSKSNCGACGNSCAATDVCSLGKCELTCATPLVECVPSADAGGGGDAGTSPYCANFDNDDSNCGACGKTCAASETCATGNCACKSGLTRCNGDCTDTKADNANCGTCGTTCGELETCTTGSCECSAGLVRCGGACIDPRNDSAYCGASADCAAANAGTACTANYQTCSQGACAPLPLTGSGTLADPWVIAEGLATCKAYKAAYGAAAADGYYSVDPNGTGLIPLYCDQTQSGGGWTRCLEFVNTAAEDVTTNDWFDTCVTYANAAWQSGDLLVDLRDTTNAIQYSSTGKKSVSWTNDNITSTTTDFTRQYRSTYHDRLITLANSDKLMIAGRSSINSACAGSMGDGYGIVLYPSEPNNWQNPKIFVIPYREFNDFPGDPRQFTPWSMDREIAWNLGASFNSCSQFEGGPSSQPFLGKFEFFVR